MDFACKPLKKLKTREDREKYNDRYMDREWACIGAMKYSKESILETCVKGFNDYEWYCGAFGGKIWGMIAKHGLRYGKISDRIFCDAAFSLSHNSNPYLDKSSTHIFKIDDSRTYEAFLNSQANKTQIDLFKDLISIYINQKFYDPEVLNFIIRVLNLMHESPDNLAKLITNYYLGFKASNDFEQMSALNLVRDYEPIKFKNTEFKPKWMPKSCNTKEEKKFIESLRVGMPCIIKETSPQFSTIEKYGNSFNSFNSLKISDISLRSGEIIITHVESGYVCKVDFRDIMVLDGIKTIKIKEKKRKKVA